MENVEPCTISAAPPQFSPSEATRLEDEPETPSELKELLNPSSEKKEGDSGEVIMEVPKKSSHIRFRKKLNKAQKQRSKGLCQSYMWIVKLVG